MDKDKGAQEKKGDSTQQLKLLLIVVLLAAVIVPFLSTTMAVKSISANIEKMNSHPHGEEEKHEESKGVMVFYEPMEFLVNLADAEISHYLRTTVSLGSLTDPVHENPAEKKDGGGHGGGHGGGEEAASPKPAVFIKIKSQEPVIRDVIISVISTYPMAALVSVNGKKELKETIKLRLEKELETENISVYFTAFTLQ
ncbi:flagellar basal body-associated FliL family protein [bacterium]|nr:flagellar basal body-associated FliL family protein [bacterium]